MNRRRPRDPRRIVLAVTSAQSLRLLVGFPEYLAARGWDVHVVYSGAQVEPQDGVAHHRLTMARHPSPWVDLRSLMSWLRLLWILRPGIVVTGTPKAGLLGILAAFVLRVPVRVYMLRGLRLATERGVRRRILIHMERLSVSGSTKVLAVSNSLRQEFLSLGLCRPEEIVVLGAGSSNGVVIPHRERESVVPATDGEQRLLVGFVGRIHEDKGVVTLLEAVEKLRQTGEDVRLLLVGAEEQPGFLNGCLSALRLDPEAVQWVGAVPDPESYYSRMDVLCLPSLREGFPNVVLEAAAHGVPTIASKVTGCVDAVVDGETGILFAAADANDLAASLSGLLDAPERVQAMGRRARQRVEQLFDRALVWERTETFYIDEINLMTAGSR